MDLKINIAKYSESKISTASEPQGDITRNLETVTHTRNRNETVIHTNNRSFEQTLLSNQTIPVVLLTMNPRIDQRITPIVVAAHTLFTPVTKEVVAHTPLGGAWLT